MAARTQTEELMSGADHGHDDHAATSHASADHAADGHGDGHADGHGHGGEALGPVDVRAWGAAVLGIASALVVTGVLWVAINPV
jgi:hypothetical protein